MPELPEVESVREGLSEMIVGEKISTVEVRWDNIIESPAVENFKKYLEGQIFEKVNRRGKFLLFYLTDYVLISHLRMEGKYQYLLPSYGEKDAIEDKHTHIIFYLESGYELRYLDVRKFGRMSLVKKGEEFEHKSLAKLGPEPTLEDFKLEEMRDFLTRRRKAIKGVLLDQEIVVGIGNIYADEILFRSQIHPEKSAKTLTAAEEEILHESIINILDEAVQKGGTTIRTYQNAFGENGSYQEDLKVYGKNGLDCPRCGTKIEKIKVVNRGTHFCPSCQELER
ncbi:MAG: DNA-formamidopyrimidine glycosylase [Atopostipes sp.]|nr:DNA-formamidopyrimidine glycosylase [Atopostipes sp.]